MRFNYYFCLLFVATCFLTLSSCDNEERVEEYVPVIYDGAEYLSHHETPTILFQYDIKQVGTNLSSGWLIDNKGNLRIYSEINPKITVDTKRETLEQFVTETEIVDQVDIETMVAMYKLRAVNVLNSEIVEKPLDAPVDNITAYYAFTLSYGRETAYSCNTTRRGGYYTRHLLESTGNLFVEDKNMGAQEILAWLKEFTAVLN